MAQLCITFGLSETILSRLNPPMSFECPIIISRFFFNVHWDYTLFKLVIETIAYKCEPYFYFILECSELVPTNHSSLSCTNKSNVIICIQTCDDGYWFDQDERHDYRCGNETYYLWDFQTKDNPYARLPFCTGTEIT